MLTALNVGLVNVLRLQADWRRFHTKRTVQLETADGVARTQSKKEKKQISI
jgi:hypothetical protein